MLFGPGDSDGQFVQKGTYEIIPLFPLKSSFKQSPPVRYTPKKLANVDRM